MLNTYGRSMPMLTPIPTPMLSSSSLLAMSSVISSSASLVLLRSSRLDAETFVVYMFTFDREKCRERGVCHTCSFCEVFKIQHRYASMIAHVVFCEFQLCIVHLPDFRSVEFDLQ